MLVRYLMIDSTPIAPDATKKVSAIPIKIATPDLKIFADDLMPIEIMTDLIFEDIGGHELIDISRNDIINGQDVLYQPIKNIASIFFQYNPQNILSLQNTSDAYFKNFPINLSDKIPMVGNGSNGEIVYIDANENLAIDLINLNSGEQVEVQIMINGTVFDDTIYGAV